MASSQRNGMGHSSGLIARNRVNRRSSCDSCGSLIGAVGSSSCAQKANPVSGLLCANCAIRVHVAAAAAAEAP